jgi:putative ABC transport system substrate-binding protein
MNKTIVKIIVGLGLIAAIFIGYRLSQSSSKKEPTIAIFKTLSHPALDDVEKGFREKMADSEFRIQLFNAEGNVQQANTIAKKISRSDNIVATLAIGTLAAQSLTKQEKERPIVIAAVSYPESIIPPGGESNTCGLSDALPAEEEIATITELLPELKSLSLIYSPHEDNSSLMVQKLQEVAKRRNITTYLFGVDESQHIQNASLSACSNADAVLIPLDNQLVAAMPAVIKATRDFPCPIITSNASPIYQGASISFGIDYIKSGQDAAAVMISLLNNSKTPKEIGFIAPRNFELFVNKAVLEKKGIKINEHTNVKIINVGDKD